MLEQSVEENKYIDVLRPKMITQRRNIVQATGVSILTHKKEIFKKSWLMELWASRQTRHPWAQGTEKSFAHKRFFCIGKKRLFFFSKQLLVQACLPLSIAFDKSIEQILSKESIFSFMYSSVTPNNQKLYEAHGKGGKVFKTLCFMDIYLNHCVSTNFFIVNYKNKRGKLVLWSCFVLLLSVKAKLSVEDILSNKKDLRKRKKSLLLLNWCATKQLFFPIDFHTIKRKSVYVLLLSS